MELLFGHRFVCWKLFLESWSKLAQPLCWKQCLGVPFQCVFAHNSFFCYFMSAVSTLSLILCLFGLFAVSVSSFDLLEILFDLSLCPSLPLPLTNGSTSLSLSHTHTHRHRHTQTDEDSVTCIWFVLKFQVGFFTGSSSDDTTIY